MVATNFISYVLIAVFGGYSFMRIISDKRYIFVTLFLNIILGGGLYLILNFYRLNIPFNLLSGSLITLLGVPGVILLVILKFIFKIF